MIKILKNDKWYLINTVGSHYQFKRGIKIGRITLPHPKKDLPTGTVRSILKQVQIKLED